MNQLAYDFIEDGDDKIASGFYDFCWNHFRNQMRTMIESYVDSEGREDFEKYLAGKHHNG